jgi:hypothetical protein
MHQPGSSAEDHHIWLDSDVTEGQLHTAERRQGRTRRCRRSPALAVVGEVWKPAAKVAAMAQRPCYRDTTTSHNQS